MAQQAPQIGEQTKVTLDLKTITLLSSIDWVMVFSF